MDWGLFLLSKCVRSFNLNQKKKKKAKGQVMEDDGRDRVIG